MDTYDKLTKAIDEAERTHEVFEYYVKNIMGEGGVPIEMMQVRDILADRTNEALAKLITITLQYNRELNEQKDTTSGG